MIDYKKIITVESDKKMGRPCIRGLRIMVDDILRWLLDMSPSEIMEEFPELNRDDLLAALAYYYDKIEKHEL